MTKQEAIVVSAYTGFLMCDFNDMHEYIEKKLGRPIYTHEFALDLIQKEIHEKVKPDFLKICEEVNKDNGTESKPKLGKWIQVDDVSYKCSVCGEISCCRGLFCPDCGTKMEVQE